MANRNLEKLASIDAQLRLLVPGKVSEDDKLIEYDALLLDKFLDVLQDLHGEGLKETVSVSLFSLLFSFFFFFSSSLEFGRLKMCNLMVDLETCHSACT